MRAVLIAGAMLLLLGGCVAVHYPEQWTRPATSLAQITADEVDCDRASRDAGWTPDLILGGVLDIVRVMIERGQVEGAYAACLRARGYSRV